MTWLFFCEALSLTLIAYYIGLGAFKFGWFVGWVADPDEYPRMVCSAILAMYGVGRDIDRIVAETWTFIAVPPKSKA